MSQKPALSPACKKDLRSRHPLYARLSGDVVWGIFEENGYDEAACGTAMDDFFARMNDILQSMNALEKNKARCFTLHPDDAQCQECHALAGQVIATSTPDWRRFLPPFAVGCTVRCVENPETMASSDSLSPPNCPLVCPLLKEIV